MKTKLFAIIPIAVFFVVGAYFGIQQVHSDSTFISLEELVSPDKISMRCEGKVEAIQNQVRPQENVTWSVT